MSNATGGPPKKKQKIEKRIAMDGPNVGLSRLTKHQIDFTPELSPGALHSNRVAIQVSTNHLNLLGPSCTCSHLGCLHLGKTQSYYSLPFQILSFNVQIILQAIQNEDNSQKLTTFFASGRDVSYLTIPSGADAMLGERGKGGVYLPRPAADVSCNLIPELSLRSEIQSITLSSLGPDSTSVLAATDSYGRAILARLRFPTQESDGGDSSRNSPHHGQPQLVGFEQFQPNNVAVEGGWAGVAIAPGQPSQIAIARHFAKDITLFDGPMAVRTIHTLYRPNAVQFLSSDLSSDGSSSGGGPLIAAAEGPVVSVWDLRSSGRGARVARLCPNPNAGHFYCLAATSSGSVGGTSLLGSAGADRSVVVWDPRTWRPIDRWTNCLKYEATSLYFLSSNPNYCVACGLDYEVVCGKWGGDKRNRIGGGHRTKGNHGEGAMMAGDDGAGGVASGGNLQDGTSSVASSDASVNLSFRGDSRWMGLAKAHGKDVLAGLTASKQLYIAELGVGL